MDLKQRKLNKSEWNSIEVSVSMSEIDILNMIIKGYHDVNIKINKNNSLFSYFKIEFSEKMENYLFHKYFKERTELLEKAIKQCNPEYKSMKISNDIKLNSGDKVRLDRFDEKTLPVNEIYETILVENMEKILSNKISGNNKMFNYHYFTLYKLIRNNINKLNSHIKNLTDIVLKIFEDEINPSIIIENAVEFIEKNQNLLKYGDLTLYEHQKDIFTACKAPNSKMILYMAPTGTGKTLTPIALSEKHKIIFVCAARHVGLALAKAAISVNKKIAFAFGCSCADDVRLHYFAAKVFTRNRRTGGIGKVDNSVGDNVEIMICDIKSYLPAMYYMLAHFEAQNIIMYWDEPTITLDYNEHDFHTTIRKNWKKNSIPNVVLSSATLPKLNELTETIPDFLNTFPGAEIVNIVSHDCKKSIPIINKDGFVVLPHYLDKDYNKIKDIANHCDNYSTLLRYFDLKEVVEFITYVNYNNYGTNKTQLKRHFETLNDVNMTNIKKYYIFILLNIANNYWGTIYTHFNLLRRPRIFENETIEPNGNKIIKSRSVGPGVDYNHVQNPLDGSVLTRLASEQVLQPIKRGTSGVYFTTKDAYTLTDGPTIIITDDIEKIAKFYIQQANIPSMVMDGIMKKIEYNNVINEKLAILETELDAIREADEKKFKENDRSGSGKKSGKDLKKFGREAPDGVPSKGSGKILNEINSLRSMIKLATINDAFIPNRKMHHEKWATGLDTKNSFTSTIDENIVSDIMALNGVDNTWKILLMMGIGVFINHENITYTEIMKKLADEQKLFMIIASSDYIYGTNYQFCHGFLSKDLKLTQEKVIQAMGRIGRNNIQQTYTVRFRDDEQIMKLFTTDTEKPEIINMNRLFNTRKVIWQNNQYVEVPDDIDDDYGTNGNNDLDNDDIDDNQSDNEFVEE
jgi:hypothetical protein